MMSNAGGWIDSELVFPS